MNKIQNRSVLQVKGFAPIGMVECWNIGKMGFDLRPIEPTARRGYCNIGYMAKVGLTIKFKMDNIL
jgi:hypothetical protein